MDESSSRDLELLLLAVQQGVLSNKQVEECLREWEEKHNAAPAGVLPSVAVAKGFVTEKRLAELASKRVANPDMTAMRFDVVMTCRDCRESQTFRLEEALQKPKCPKCLSTLRFQKQSGSTSVQAPRAVPDDVRKAMADPKSRFSKYVLISKLGTGGMGEVWRAWDTVMHRSIALKFPRTTGEEEIRRLYLEAQGAGSLNHPNVASIYEIAEAEGRHYIAMQYINGKTADEANKSTPKPPLKEVIRWVRDAALGVHYAHETGVIHRDLKPANLMIDVEGRVYVMDFGLAKLTGGEGSATVSGAILGTPAFMPPEQAAANASQVDRRSDIYSLGATLYVLASGRRPFEGDSATEILVQILTTEPPMLRQVLPGAPWELEAILARAMARPREGRYQTAKEFASDLDRFLANEPIQARRQTLTHRFMRKAKKHAGVAIAAAVIIVLAAAAAIFYARSTQVPVAGPAGPDRMKEWSEMFPKLQRALAVETFDPAAAGPMLSRIERDFPEQKAGIDLMLDREFKDVLRSLEEMPRSAWLESASRVRRTRDWLSFAKKPTESADRILAYRGTITLTIQVSPYAEVRGPMVDALPPEERLTPFMRRDLEILDGALELVHPQLGTRSVKLPPLRHGSSITIEGSMKDPQSIKISEGS